jgi:WD40 repeat protein
MVHGSTTFAERFAMFGSRTPSSQGEDLDQDELSSVYDTITSEPVVSADDTPRLPIKALTCDASGKFFCCGKEDCIATIYDIPDGTKVRKISGHSSAVSVIRLAWSHSEKYLISADDSGRVIAKRLEPPEVQDPKKWTLFPLFDMRVDEEVEHFLFSTPEDHLLGVGPTTARIIISLKSEKEVCRTSHLF